MLAGAEIQGKFWNEFLGKKKENSCHTICNTESTLLFLINSHLTSLSVVGGGLSAGSQQCGVQQYIHSGIWVSSGCHPDRSLRSLGYLASWYASCSSRKASREMISRFIQQQQNFHWLLALLYANTKHQQSLLLVITLHTQLHSG